MFPVPLSLYIYAFCALITGGSLFYGHYEHTKYVDYQQQIALTVQHQKDLVDQEKQSASLITDNIVSGYTSYINRMRNNNGAGGLRPLSTASTGTDVSFCTPEFSNAVNETQVQLEYLQKWVEEQCKLGCAK